MTDRTFDLRLGGPDDDDGISVVEEAGSRWITARNFGFEASEELPDEVADLLVCVLWKISERLKGSGVGRDDGETEQ